MQRDCTNPAETLSTISSSPESRPALIGRFILLEPGNSGVNHRCPKIRPGRRRHECLVPIFPDIDPAVDLRDHDLDPEPALPLGVALHPATLPSLAKRFADQNSSRPIRPVFASQVDVANVDGKAGQSGTIHWIAVCLNRPWQVVEKNAAERVHELHHVRRGGWLRLILVAAATADKFLLVILPAETA